MSDIEEMVKRLRAGTNGWNSNPAMKAAADALEAQAKRIAELEARAAMLLSACSKMNDEVSQILGKALRYPRYCDDQDVFPGAVESDGVFVGEHVCQSIADEAAQKIAQLEASLADSNEALQVMGLKLAHAEAKIDALMLEYCPDEMTPEQVENWGKHQRRVSPERTAEIDRAIALGREEK